MNGIVLRARVRISRRCAASALFAALLFVPGGVAIAQEPPLHTATREELDIVKVVVTQEKAWNAGDIQGYMNGYKRSPDTIFMGRQMTRGYDHIFEDYKRNYPGRGAMGTLTFTELEAHPLSDTYAICLGHYHLDRAKKDGGPADGVFSLVLEKTNEGWKIVLDHTN